MKKGIKRIKGILLLLLAIGIVSTWKVEALGLNTRRVFDNETNIITGDEITNVDCSGIFTKDALDLISDVLLWVRILAPIALIVLIAVDFGTAVLSQDNDALKKAGGKILRRVLATVAVFFIPTLIRVLINLPGVRDSIQIPDDPLCGTMQGIEQKEEWLLN